MKSPSFQWGNRRMNGPLRHLVLFTGLVLTFAVFCLMWALPATQVGGSIGYAMLIYVGPIILCVLEARLERRKITEISKLTRATRAAKWFAVTLTMGTAMRELMKAL